MIQAPVGWQCPDCVSTAAKTSPTKRVTFGRPGTRTGIVGATNPTPVVITLVVINVAVFFASGFGKASVITRYGDAPVLIHGYHQYYRFLDSMFLHLNVPHILFNMLALLIVGPAVEVLIGRVRFIALYLLAGFGGGVAYYLIAPPVSVAAGASGAIFGIMGAYVVLAYRRRLPYQQVVALIALNLIIGFTGNIGWQAHVGGLITGAAVAFVYHQAMQLRPTAREIAVTVGSSVATFAVLALLVAAIAPGHINLGS
jgi:membrane associated rhomboid family serine protease